MTLDEVVRSLETPAAFAAWLDEQNGNAHVGLPALANLCPIASYAREQGVDGYVTAAVKRTGGAFALFYKGHRRLLPEWCQFFAEMVDDEYDVCKRDAGHRPDDYPITAAMALRFLGHVAQELTSQAEDMAELVLV